MDEKKGENINPDTTDSKDISNNNPESSLNNKSMQDNKDDGNKETSVSKKEDEENQNKKESEDNIQPEIKKENIDMIQNNQKEKIKEEGSKEKKNDLESDEDDEEISIDFSKITSFFKKKKNKTETLDSKKLSDDEKKPIIQEKIQTKSEKSRTNEIFNEEKEEDDEEISFDFSKIKNIFKGSKEKNIKKPETEYKDSKDEDFSIDWKKAGSFINKHKVVLLILIPLILSVFFRIQPAYLPATDKWAEDTVINSIKSQIASQIDLQAPNLPANLKSNQVEAQLEKTLKEQKSEIKQQITATSNYFKSRMQDDSGQTYLLAIDPWFWMRHARNVLENGHPGDEIREGIKWDNHMFAPDGRGIPADMFHAYFEAYLYKLVSFFNKNVSLMAVVFYVPIILSALCVIPAFFISRRFGGNFGGFIGAVLVAIHPAFLNRTAGGFADTDAYNILFPLLITWLFLEAVESKNIKKTLLLSSLSGLFVGLFAFAWGGWWFIFDFVIASAVISLVYYIIVHRDNLSNIFKRNEVKSTLYSLGAFIAVSGIFTTIFKSFNTFINGPIFSPIGFSKLKEVGIRTVWPNVFTTVAEQNSASLNSVIGQIGMGNWMFLLISLIGIALTLTRINEKKKWFIYGTIGWYLIVFLVKPQNLNLFLFLISIPIIIRLFVAVKESDKEIDLKYSAILILWLISTIYASVKGIRFMLLLVPAFSIGFGIALGQAYRYANRLLTKAFDINKIISKATVIILLLLILISPLKAAQDTAIQEIPSMNDAWFASLDKINKEAKADAIINSWWDFGHWFKYVGDRAVTFDGTSQNTPQAHWIGNSLLTSDEDKAVGILRMLDCSGFSGGTYAYNTIYEIVKDEPESIEIIYDIVVLDKDDAKKSLESKGFNSEDIDKILSYTHCNPPENYYITSDDMIGKSGVWAHFGAWDFNRALIYKTLKSAEYKENIDKSTFFLQDRFNYSKKDAEDIYYEVQGIINSEQANSWIAPWPSYAGSVGCSKIDNETLKCSSFTVNLTTQDIYLLTTEGKKYPSKFSFMTDEDVSIKEYDKEILTLQNGRNLGLALIKNGESYSVLQMDESLTGSIFTRLFYMEGVGLKHFKKFSDERSLTGGRIIVWKVDWEGKEKNVISKNNKDIEIINDSETDTLPDKENTLNDEDSKEEKEENLTLPQDNNSNE